VEVRSSRFGHIVAALVVGLRVAHDLKHVLQGVDNLTKPVFLFLAAHRVAGEWCKRKDVLAHKQTEPQIEKAKIRSMDSATDWSITSD
jgi:hypothetical protein